MKYSLLFRTDALIIASILFIVMIIMVRLGMVVSKMRKDTDLSIRDGIGSLRGAVFGLFAFILAFCFNMSGNRYDLIRKIFIEESNHISTAVHRSDLYSDSLRTAFRADFREYLEARINLYSNLRDIPGYLKKLENMNKIYKRIWHRTTEESKKPNMLIPSNNMITALTNMNDTANTREVMLRTSVPDVIIYTLLILALLSSFTAGVTSSNLKFREWVIIICFAFFTSLVIYMTLDLGRPMRGIIKADRSQQAIVDLRRMF